MDKLNSRQRRFVDEYLVDYNGIEAAIRAGYRPKGARTQARRLLNDPRVQQQVGRHGLDASAAITPEWVIARLRLICDRCMQAVPVRQRKGGDNSEWKFDAPSACRATELLGKHLGMFTEKFQMTNRLDFTRLNDDQLAVLERLLAYAAAQSPNPGADAGGDIPPPAALDPLSGSADGWLPEPG